MTLDPGAEQRTILAAERNQLAAERTFLAWLRTGIACIGGGVAFERVLSFQAPLNKVTAYLVGLLLIFLGIGIFIVALLEYERAYTQFKQYNAHLYVSMPWRRLVVAILLIISLLFLYLITE